MYFVNKNNNNKRLDYSPYIKLLFSRCQLYNLNKSIVCFFKISLLYYLRENKKKGLGYSLYF